MYGKTAKPFWESGGSVHLKTILTNSSGMTSEVDFVFKMFDIVADGKPFDLNALETWVSSFLSPSAVLGRLSAGHPLRK